VQELTNSVVVVPGVFEPFKRSRRSSTLFLVMPFFLPRCTQLRYDFGVEEKEAMSPVVQSVKSFEFTGEIGKMFIL
jgi:hypothetical protein